MSDDAAPGSASAAAAATVELHALPESPKPEAAGLDARSLYINQLRAEAAVFPQTPDVEVRYDFSYTLQLPATTVNHDIPTVAQKFRGLALAPVSLAKALGRVLRREPSTATQAVPILSNCTGVLKPGTLTLLLAPPGHGKTCFLKALAGRLPLPLEGSVTYSGKSAAELKAEGVHLKLLANYVDQLDVHLPYLTVRETATFACVNSTVEPEVMGNEMLIREAANRVERVIQLLKLSGCANTLVGNNLVRGVSGGEKKRVTVAEALVSNARLLCMDEISTGLDASVTYDICASIKAWTTEMNGTVIIALLQPTPEVYSLFDDILLLREGSVVYHGARALLPGYLAGLGFSPPADDADGDIADWLTDLLASPTKLLRAQLASSLPSLPSAMDLADLELPADVPRTTAALVARWTASTICAARAAASAPPELLLKSDFAKRQYGRPYPRSAATHFKALLRRQFQITIRNSLFVTTRIVSSIVISIILGTVWYQLTLSQGLSKFGMLLFAVLQVAFSNFAETPFAVEYKFIAYKHINAGMYPPWAYTLSATIVQLPTAVAETAAFSVILYFMVGLVADGGRWAFFAFTLYLVNVGLGSLFRLIAYVVPNYEAAQTAPGPFIAIQVIFAGFLIAPNHMGSIVNGTPWLIFMYYCSVFAYALRSLAQNEFYSPVYNIFSGNYTGAASAAVLASTGGTLITPVTSNSNATTYYSASSCAALPGLDCAPFNYGYTIIKGLNINTEVEWKWGGVGFLAFFLILINAVSGWALASVNIERNIGTSRVKDEDEAGAAGAAGGGGGNTEEVAFTPTTALKTVRLEMASVASVLPFSPMVVTWRDLKYTVTLNKNLGGGTKCLLQGVSGIANPQRLIALMGASGAGKSTLLDVIAGRKTAGAMEGGIFLNGFPREPKSFARLTAYCEQQDIHNSFATVQEALTFSAALRLPASVDGETRAAYVQEVTELLELNYIANRLIGEVGAANGLAPGQRKILTIAVELVSNAPILFLDEPTSGLDARAANVVVREVRKIADTGRTVITTVHQPSAEIFFRFDEILLMQRGGYMAYFGPVGKKGADLIAFMEAVPGVHPCPSGMNPASWMLDVLAGADSSGGRGRESSEEEAEATRAALPAPISGRSRSGGSYKDSYKEANSRRSGSFKEAPAVSPEPGTPKTPVRGVSVAASAATAAPAAPGPAPAISGEVVQAHLFGTEQWAAVSKAIAEASLPKPGTEPYRFASVYAHPFGRQLRVVLYRALVSYNRNVGYIYTKTMVLWGLMIMFGTIYYKIKQSFDCAPATGTDNYSCINDLGGVQSIVSCTFLTTLFIGILCMNTMLPVLMRERAVFYRERFSYMYQPEAHSLSYAIAEVPWLVLLVFLITTCFYFMAGFNPAAAYYFFYILVTIVFSYVFISIGMWASAYFPTAEVAQAVVGLVIPIAFLFGGLYLPKPQIPNGGSSNPPHPHVYWLWAYYLDPISYALEALVPAQFADQSTPSNVHHDVAIPGQAPVNSLKYVEGYYDAKYSNRWADLGYMALFIVGLQALQMYATRYKLHIDR